MKKSIEKIALSSMYSNNIDRLMEVITATPNAKIAVETLLGIYEMPVIAKRKEIGKIKATLVSFDKWNDTIHYSYERKKSIGKYVPKDKKEYYENCPIEEYVNFGFKHNDDAIYIYRTTEESETITDTIHLEKWEKAKEWLTEIEQDWKNECDLNEFESQSDEL